MVSCHTVVTHFYAENLTSIVAIAYTIGVMKYCPFCKSHKGMTKCGVLYTKDGRMQRWKCTNKPCGRLTIKPLNKK